MGVSLQTLGLQGDVGLAAGLELMIGGTTFHDLEQNCEMEQRMGVAHIQRLLSFLPQVTSLLHLNLLQLDLCSLSMVVKVMMGIILQHKLCRLCRLMRMVPCWIICMQKLTL